MSNKYVSPSNLERYDGKIKEYIDEKYIANQGYNATDADTGFTLHVKSSDGINSGISLEDVSDSSNKTHIYPAYIESKSFQATNSITVGGKKVLTEHPTVSTSTDTTSTATAKHGDTVTMVDSVTRDGDGHVTKVNTKTVTLPSDNNTTYSLTKSGTTITLTGSDGSKTSVEDSEGVDSSVYQDDRILLQIDGGTSTGYEYSIHCGLNNTIKGNCSLSVGRVNNVTANAISCGTGNTIANSAFGTGYNNSVGTYSVVGGNNNVYNTNCVGYLAVGAYNTSSHYSIVGGTYNDFNNACGMAIGLYGATPESYSHVSYFGGNRDSSTAFLIGNGTSTAKANGFRITFSGNAYGKEFVSSGADYAEFISEWADGNPDAEDRVGYMVTIKDNKLYKANEGDYIVGITSGNPSVVGNGDETYFWKYERDEFNRFVYADTEVPTWVKQTDEEGNEILDENGEPIWIESDTETTTIKALKLADGYNPNQEYIPRKDRPEWDYIGMIGVVPVRDDGTCEVGSFCKCGVEGVATSTTEKTFGSYFVKERISENVISVVLN